MTRPRYSSAGLAHSAADEAPERADLAPGFWNDWQFTSHLATAIQYPLCDPQWQNRVINGHVRDGQESRRTLALAAAPAKEPT